MMSSLFSTNDWFKYYLVIKFAFDTNSLVDPNPDEYQADKNQWGVLTSIPKSLDLLSFRIHEVYMPLSILKIKIPQHVLVTLQSVNNRSEWYWTKTLSLKWTMERNIHVKSFVSGWLT